MDLQERYDELDNIINTIDMLIDEISDKYYKDSLNLIKYEAQSELDEIAEKLEEEQKKEERQQERDYWEAVV